MSISGVGTIVILAPVGYSRKIQVQEQQDHVSGVN